MTAEPKNRADPAEPPLVAILTRSLSGGGVQRMMQHVAAELLARGYRVHLLTPAAEPGQAGAAGAEVFELPAGSVLRGRWLALRADPGGWRQLLRPVLVPAGAPGSLRHLEALADYLRCHRPAALLSATTYLNVTSLLARRLAGVPTEILVSERDNLSHNLTHGRNRRAWRWRHAPPLLGRLYAEAEAVVGVSRGVSEDLAHLAGLPPSRIATVYNPVVTPKIAAQAAMPAGDPWLDRKDRPVFLAAGRLVEKKAFGDLIAAVARLRQARDVRLVILGEGRERERLEGQARALGIGGAVRFPGWVGNPYAYMARADAFALTSRREGFGNVLVEALACGCPVVSTDCPSGPAEILADGAFGRLVPVGDVAALARALADTLDAPPKRDKLRERAEEFTAGRAVDRYLGLLGLPPAPGHPGTVPAEAPRRGGPADG